jgi:putative tryptophan/tyrosine transport system substrate-binding protein
VISVSSRVLRPELLAARVDVIAAIGAVSADAVRRVSSTVPIVYAVVIDPLIDGFASHLNNSVGITTFDPDQAKMHVSLLQQVRPDLRRVAVLADQGASPCLAQINVRAFGSRGIEAYVVGISGPRPDLAQAFASIDRFRSEALVVLEHPTNGTCRSRIATLANETGLPSLFPRDYANAGGLMAYGTSLRAATRQLPERLRRLLEGQVSPVVRFHHPELLINRNAARAQGRSAIGVSKGASKTPDILPYPQEPPSRNVQKCGDANSQTTFDFSAPVVLPILNFERDGAQDAAQCMDISSKKMLFHVEMPLAQQFS